MKPLVLAAICIYLGMPGAAVAQDDSGDVPMVVVVPGTKGQPSWPYRHLAAGVEEFEKKNALAPAARLRFKLRILNGKAPPQNASMDLVGKDWSAPLALEQDLSFALKLNDKADDDDAHVVVANKGVFDPAIYPKAEVRTPGLPEHVRRMGDVRLECQVSQRVAKKVFGFFVTASLNAIGGMDWCHSRQPKGFSAAWPAPFTKAEIVDGARRAVIYEGKPRTYAKVPVHDAAWSDEALIVVSSPSL